MGASFGRARANDACITVSPPGRTERSSCLPVPRARTRAWGAGRGLGGLALAAALTVACGDGGGTTTHCERECPYEVVVSAADGALPASTVLTVKHGAGQVDYRLSSPPAESDVVFCATEPTAGGAAVLRLRCDVWTQGAITVTAEADGYEPVEDEVSLAKLDGCVVTQSVQLSLSEASGP